MKEKILITGAAGMVGSHMIEYFNQFEAYNVVGSFYKPTIDISDILNKCELIESDLRYFKPVLNLISNYKPNRIFHLAAQSYPAISWDKAQDTLEINVNSTLHIFDAILEVKKIDPNYDPVVVIACSSAEYGQTMIDAIDPVLENDQLLPLSPYGISKVAQDLLGFQYYQSHKIKTIRARIFNTTGPRKSGDVLSDFIQRAVNKKFDSNFIFNIGNIETIRSITDVRDLVTALVLLSEHGAYGEAYNICSDSKYKISELLDIVENITNVKLDPVVDPNLFRPTDEKIIIGDNSKLKLATGWKPTIRIEKTVEDMFTYELKKMIINED